MQDPEVLEEFKLEADEMLNESEEFLLNMEKGEDFTENFNGIFRAFHSLKGAAGMFEIDDLQAFMHKIETQFESLREVGQISQEQIDYFLKAVDSARRIMDGGEPALDTNEFSGMAEGSTSSEVEETEIADVSHEQEAASPTPQPTPQPEAQAQAQTTAAVQEKVSHRKEEIEQKGKGLVYVVDDEKLICEALEDILQRFGYKVETFVDSPEALERIKEKEPDLLCTDLKMPEMTGIELLDELRKAKIDCPVIFITAFVDNKLLTKGFDLGASGFLEKPFEDHHVISLANQAIEKSQTKRLLNRSLNYILYQYNDLDNYLKKEGKEVLRQNLKEELENLLKLRRNFK